MALPTEEFPIFRMQSMNWTGKPRARTIPLAGFLRGCFWMAAGHEDPAIEWERKLLCLTQTRSNHGRAPGPVVGRSSLRASWRASTAWNIGLWFIIWSKRQTTKQVWMPVPQALSKHLRRAASLLEVKPSVANDPLTPTDHGREDLNCPQERTRVLVFALH